VEWPNQKLPVRSSGNISVKATRLARKEEKGQYIYLRWLHIIHMAIGKHHFYMLDCSFSLAITSLFFASLSKATIHF
jgi:hypothetical protein